MSTRVVGFWRRASLFSSAILRVPASALLLSQLGMALAPASSAAVESSLSLSARLAQFPERGYLGGMPLEVRLIALEVRSSVEKFTGEPLARCSPPNPLAGEVIATGVGVEPAGSEAQTIPVLIELQGLLSHDRRFVRDAAAFLIGEIGPSARSLEADLSGSELGRSPWFTHALTSVTCQKFAMSTRADLVPTAVWKRVLEVDAEVENPTFDQRLQVITALLEREDLRWPDDFFSTLAGGDDEAASPGTQERIVPHSVATIAERALDESAPYALRMDLIELLRSLGAASAPAAEQLWQLANHGNGELAFAAADALLVSGTDLAMDSAMLLIKRFDAGFDFLPDALCADPRAPEMLGPVAERHLRDPHWSEATVAAEWLGCLGPERYAGALRQALQHPSWETQRAAIEALGKSAELDAETRAALAEIRSTHWSGLIRDAAQKALRPDNERAESRAAETVESDEVGIIEMPCFHRCLNDHGRRCGDDQGIVDGLYVSPSLGELMIEWERVRRVPKPAGFPAQVKESSRPDYGSSTYLRVEDGWLYGVDRWHYGGHMAHVDDEGRETPIAAWGDSVSAIIESPHFGRIALGGSLFGVGDAGVLAQVERTDTGWQATPRVALPSPPWGWAFTANGTLLVADPYEAVAVHEDGRIESLECPVRSPSKVPSTLLRAAAMAPRAPSALRLRDALDAVEIHKAAFEAQRERALAIRRDENMREPWESPQIVEAWLRSSFENLLDAQLAAGRAGEALGMLQQFPAELVAASLRLRFQVYAATGRATEARAQLLDLSATQDAGALRLAAMLALADRRLDAAQLFLDQIASLAERAQHRSDADPYVSLLQGLSSGVWPERAERVASDDSWPAPIEDYLAGRSSERQLVLASHGRDGRIDRERLTEALFFSGLKLVRERRDRSARAHFQAVVELGVETFFEHSVAKVLLASVARDNSAPMGRVQSVR